MSHLRRRSSTPKLQLQATQESTVDEYKTNFISPEDQSTKLQTITQRTDSATLHTTARDHPSTNVISTHTKHISSINATSNPENQHVINTHTQHISSINAASNTENVMSTFTNMSTSKGHTSISTTQSESIQKHDTGSVDNMDDLWAAFDIPSGSTGSIAYSLSEQMSDYSMTNFRHVDSMTENASSSTTDNVQTRSNMKSAQSSMAEQQTNEKQSGSSAEVINLRREITRLRNELTGRQGETSILRDKLRKEGQRASELEQALAASDAESKYHIKRAEEIAQKRVEQVKAEMGFKETELREIEAQRADAVREVSTKSKELEELRKLLSQATGNANTRTSSAAVSSSRQNETNQSDNTKSTSFEEDEFWDIIQTPNSFKSNYPYNPNHPNVNSPSYPNRNQPSDPNKPNLLLNDSAVSRLNENCHLVRYLMDTFPKQLSFLTVAATCSADEIMRYSVPLDPMLNVDQIQEWKNLISSQDTEETQNETSNRSKNESVKSDLHATETPVAGFETPHISTTKPRHNTTDIETSSMAGTMTAQPESASTHRSTSTFTVDEKHLQLISDCIRNPAYTVYKCLCDLLRGTDTPTKLVESLLSLAYMRNISDRFKQSFMHRYAQTGKYVQHLDFFVLLESTPFHIISILAYLRKIAISLLHAIVSCNISSRKYLILDSQTRMEPTGSNSSLLRFDPMQNAIHQYVQSNTTNSNQLQTTQSLIEFAYDLPSDSPLRKSLSMRLRLETNDTKPSSLAIRKLANQFLTPQTDGIKNTCPSTTPTISQEFMNGIRLAACILYESFIQYPPVNSSANLSDNLSANSYDNSPDNLSVNSSANPSANPSDNPSVKPPKHSSANSRARSPANSFADLNCFTVLDALQAQWRIDWFAQLWSTLRICVSTEKDKLRMSSNLSFFRPIGIPPDVISQSFQQDKLSRMKSAEDKNSFVSSNDAPTQHTTASNNQNQETINSRATTRESNTYVLSTKHLSEMFSKLSTADILCGTDGTIHCALEAFAIFLERLPQLAFDSKDRHQIKKKHELWKSPYFYAIASLNDAVYDVLFIAKQTLEMNFPQVPSAQNYSALLALVGPSIAGAGNLLGSILSITTDYEDELLQTYTTHVQLAVCHTICDYLYSIIFRYKHTGCMLLTGLLHAEEYWSEVEYSYTMADPTHSAIPLVCLPESNNTEQTLQSETTDEKPFNTEKASTTTRDSSCTTTSYKDEEYSLSKQIRSIILQLASCMFVWGKRFNEETRNLAIAISDDWWRVIREPDRTAGIHKIERYCMCILELLSTIGDIFGLLIQHMPFSLLQRLRGWRSHVIPSVTDCTHTKMTTVQSLLSIYENQIQSTEETVSSITSSSGSTRQSNSQPDTHSSPSPSRTRQSNPFSTRQSNSQPDTSSSHPSSTRQSNSQPDTQSSHPIDSSQNDAERLEVRLRQFQTRVKSAQSFFVTKENQTYPIHVYDGELKRVPSTTPNNDKEWDQQSLTHLIHGINFVALGQDRLLVIAKSLGLNPVSLEYSGPKDFLDLVTRLHQASIQSSSLHTLAKLVEQGGIRDFDPYALHSLWTSLHVESSISSNDATASTTNENFTENTSTKSNRRNKTSSSSQVHPLMANRRPTKRSASRSKK